MDLVIGGAHVSHESNEMESILNAKPSSIPQKVIMDQLIFKSKDVVCALVHDIDLNFAKGMLPVRSNFIDCHEFATNFFFFVLVKKTCIYGAQMRKL